MTVDELVERFVVIALDQDRTLLIDHYAKFNRLFDQMEAGEQGLKRGMAIKGARCFGYTTIPTPKFG